MPCQCSQAKAKLLTQVFPLLIDRLQHFVPAPYRWLCKFFPFPQLVAQLGIAVLPAVAADGFFDALAIFYIND